MQVQASRPAWDYDLRLTDIALVTSFHMQALAPLAKASLQLTHISLPKLRFFRSAGRIVNN